MQRVYQFHHFGEGAETYRSPWGKATLRERALQHFARAIGAPIRGSDE